MIVGHADGLHERVTNGGADKFEAGFLESEAHGIGFGGPRRDVRQAAIAGVSWGAVHELPEKGVQRSVGFEQLEGGARIDKGCLDFETIADNPRIGEEALGVAGREAGYSGRVKPPESLAIGFPFSENRKPGQTCLRSFEDQHFEQPLVVMDRPPPLFIMVTKVRGIVRHPSATRLPVGAGMKILAGRRGHDRFPQARIRFVTLRPGNRRHYR